MNFILFLDAAHTRCYLNRDKFRTTLFDSDFFVEVVGRWSSLKNTIPNSNS